MTLKNKVCLITGGSSGIGKATAELLASKGVKISVCDVDQANGEKLAKELNEKYGKDTAIFNTCDVTSIDSFRSCFKKTKDKFGYVDILHNNAGIWNDSPSSWSRQIDINLKGVVNGCILAIEFMGTKQGGKGGDVVNMSSYLGIVPNPLMPIYSATKAGVYMLTRDLGSELHYGLNKIRYMSICPNGTTTNLFQDVEKHFLLSDPEVLDFFKAATAVSPFQGPEVVARAILDALEKGENGSTWAVAFGGPAKPVKITELPMFPPMPEEPSISFEV